MQVNSFNMADVDVGQSGLFLHSALAMVNHSCIPNAFVQFAGRRAILRAYRAIEKDEEVEISYIGKLPLHCIYMITWANRDNIHRMHTASFTSSGSIEIAISL